MRYEEVFPLPGDRLIDQEESLAEAVHRWGEVEVVRRRLEHREDYEELLAPAMHRLFVEIGLQKMIWSEESGGGGLESADLATTLVAALEQVGRADVGIAFLLANTLAIQFSFGLKPHRDEALCGRLAEVFCREPTGEPARGGTNRERGLRERGEEPPWETDLGDPPRVLHDPAGELVLTRKVAGLPA